MKKRDRVMEIVESRIRRLKDVRKNVPRIVDADGDPVTRSQLKKIKRDAHQAWPDLQAKVPLDTRGDRFTPESTDRALKEFKQ